ncbi:MAG: hypothetical protein WA103_02345 [Minisyncoccales bacterium]
MMEFLYHEGMQKEIAALERRFATIRDGFSIFERLCLVQFNPTNPRQVVAPAKLHRVTQNNIWSLWKVELVIPKSGLRPNQWPRVWFAVRGEIIVFLCVAIHMDNYDDEKMNRIALSRVTDFF